MSKQKSHRRIWLATVAMALVVSVSATAQSILPANVETEQMMDAIAQTNGEFDSVNMNYMHSLGMQQKAWNDPLSHMGEGQSKPGYSKYTWTPDVILPIRLREGMMTLINLPTWELIEKVHIGSPESFGGEIAAPNSLLVYADPSYLGVDSNMIIFGRSGNRYVFYLRSETYNTEKITQSVVDVLVGPRYTPVEYGGKLGNFNGATTTAGSGTLTGSGSPAWASGRGSGQNPQIGLNTASTGPKDWLKNIPVDPESFHFDIDMYLPNPADVDIAPDNVWRDNIFTYIDFGPKALTMTQRPIVNLIVQDTEVPVGFRTSGPNSRLIVVEGIGDMVLRNGQKIICLKLRRDPSSGLEYTDYSGSQSNSITKPSTISREPVDLMPKAQNAPEVATAEETSVAQNNARQIEAYMNNLPASGTTASATAQQQTTAQATTITIPQQAAVIYEQNMAPLPAIPAQVMNSPSASANIVGVINDVVSTSPATASTNRAMVDRETISVELGTNADISALESIWETIYTQNQDTLKGYEPYYSVDTTADGGVRELFRLRVGPVKDVDTADKLCKKLGRRGFSCSVIRVQ